MGPSPLWIRISRSRFLDTFWPKVEAPAPPESAGYRQKPRRASRILDSKFQRIVTEIQGSVIPTESFTRYINDGRLAPGFKLTLSQGAPAEYPQGRWASLERDTKTKPDWAKQKVLFRFCAFDPFRELDTYERTGRNTNNGNDPDRESILEDIQARVQDRFVDQHVTAVFVVVVHESSLRLTRTDRAGMLLTERFDYLESSELLLDLFSRISALTDEQLGWDPTVTAVLPGSPDHDLMERLRAARPDDFPVEEGSIIDGDVEDPSRTFVFARKLYDTSLSSSKARWRLSVPLEDGSSHDFLVGRPFNRRTDCQRNGRAYIAVDCETGGFVFLKDAWRFAHDDPVRLREGQALALLNQARVPHVPTLVCEADLPGQSARTRGFHPFALFEGATPSEADDITEDDIVFAIEDDYEHGSLCPMHHYRFAVRELCIDLQENFKSGPQLLTLLKDLIVGKSHAGAATLAESPMLHGDISHGNCMIHPRLRMVSPGRHVVQWEGMLIDWELNTPLPDAEVNIESAHGKQIKTWQYASVAYCQRPLAKRLAIADDMESFLWLTASIAFRFLRSNLTVNAVRIFLNDLNWAEWHSSGGRWHVSAVRHRTIMAGRLWGSLFQVVLQGQDADGRLVNSPINDFFMELAHLCRAVYLRDNEPEGHLMEFWPRNWNPAAKPPPSKLVNCETLARKLDDHTAVLALIDDFLSKEWPVSDYVGDQRLTAREPQPAEALAAVEEDKENRPVKAKAAKGKKKARAPAARRKRGAAAKKPALPARAPVEPADPPSDPEHEGENPLKRRRNPLRQCHRGNVAAQPGERPAKRRRH